MLIENGAEKLRKFTRESFHETITEIVPGVWHILGMGHSTAVVIEAENSVILVDTLDSLERGRTLLEFIKKTTEKEVKTIIYTHGHPDHRGGAGAFLDSQPEIIAFSPKTPSLGKTELLMDVQNLRGGRQFGYTLSDEENISQGIGRREGAAYGEKRAFVQPDTVYSGEKISRIIDGVSLELFRVPGEAEDAAAIWLPEKKVLCCGDVYYGCFPNLYAIRGGQYRDIAGWIKSLELLMSYPAEYLLSGHTKAICGKEQIKEELGNFKGAIEYLLTSTLEGMNAGKGPDELAAKIQLPKEYQELSCLGEYYGCAEWTIRAIYDAYLGWFDGNPTHLHPLDPKKRAEKMTEAMGGKEAVLEKARSAIKEKEYQWCLELCDLLEDSEAAALKAEALAALAEYETSANGRHYYLACAEEIRNSDFHRSL